MNWKIIIRDNRVRIFSLLLLIWIINLYSSFSYPAFLYPLTSIFVFASLDLLWTFYQTKKFYYPFSSLVSGLLIGLIISPDSGFGPFILAPLIGFTAKQFIKLKKRTLFNPAALAVVTTGLLFHLNASWWTVASGGIFLFIIILSGFVLWKLKRLHVPLIFISVYFLYLLISANFQTARVLTLDGTIFLFSFIMLPEPMTSLISGNWKYLFPVLVLLLFALINILKISTPDPLLTSLLIANLITRIIEINQTRGAGR